MHILYYDIRKACQIVFQLAFLNFLIILSTNVQQNAHVRRLLSDNTHLTVNNTVTRMGGARFGRWARFERRCPTCSAVIPNLHGGCRHYSLHHLAHYRSTRWRHYCVPAANFDTIALQPVHIIYRFHGLSFNSRRSYGLQLCQQFPRYSKIVTF